MSNWSEIKKQAKASREELRILYKKFRGKLSRDERKELKALIKAIDKSLRKKDEEKLDQLLKEAQKVRSEKFSGVVINRTWEAVKEILWILFIVFLIRWLLIEPFRIPSGSMIPTLLVGDQLMVCKFIYGVQIPLTTKKLFNLKKPKRGDVIVFKYPLKPSQDFVKRVIGVEGDEVMLKDGELYINGRKVWRKYIGPYNGPIDEGFCPSYDLYLERIDGTEHQIILCRRSHEGDDFGPVRVPKGAVFVMGDNRDNSADSRVWGFVPLGNIKGKALFIHLPLDPSRHYLPRWRRFFKVIR